ncbi:DUF6302 family protein [Streptomyces sp. NPDC029006]|uniref:DUF6302 family protein n=1 Tax=Streptomyces sp. NPDC029006 TaxID=3155467 RepID=UPI0033CC2AD4
MTARTRAKQRAGVPVDVRAADRRDEWETSWYRERLRDPALIDAGVVVAVGRVGYLAVPVGGTRRGGYISTGDRMAVDCLRDALTGRPGFPRVRVRWSKCRSACHVVAWGEDPPGAEDDDQARGEFYGYSEQAIRAFVAELARGTN